MDVATLLRIGVLVDVKTKDGRTITGYLDEVGITQHEKKILIANQRPQIGTSFTCKKIDIEKVDSIQLSSADKANF